MLCLSDLQSSQQVAGLSQSGPGSVQLLQQLVLRLLQRGDLPLGCFNIILPLLYFLLQPRHLQGGQTDRQSEAERTDSVHTLLSVTLQAVAQCGTNLETTSAF